MASPLSKRKGRGSTSSSNQRVHSLAIAQVASPEDNPSFGGLALDAWLASYEYDVLQYESIGSFAEVKLKEALVLSSKFAAPLNRFRAAVVCSLFERVALALAEAESCKRFAPTIVRLSNELLALIFADMDDPSLPTLRRPHTLSYFMAKAPYFAQLRLEVSKKDQEFLKHQAVLRRLIQATFQNVGSVFHAWKTHARTKREDRLAKKAAEITGKVLMKRGQTRVVFVSWARYTMSVRFEQLRFREAHSQREHTQIVAELRKQLSQAHDTIAVLRAEAHGQQVQSRG
ncbi:hypothetical protein ACHHYP_06951 [Achlya hypogyna]|uniref:Uncharacterized protein n=1 Tax=Achlya hypogyna TaxID=1202772 RepID=A0A1V9ZN34_ACHHY|nr:hypothetical protein ACHHYP_06951 [Achlya hypogyna]